VSTKAWLDGARADLALVADLFANGDVRVERADGGYALTSPRLDGLISEGGKLREAAEELVTEVNGIATLHYATFGPVRLTGRFEEAAGHRHAVVAAGVARARVVMPPVGVVINGQAQPRIAPGDAYPEVAEVLRILGGRPFDWAEIYKIYEIVQDDIKPRKLHETGWITKAELSRLKENCNRAELGGPTARHARMGGAAGSAPLEIKQAREQIRAVAMRWIESLQP
jgi:hypothetical protein